MWFPVLGVVCAGLFVGAAVSQFVKHNQQHDSDADEASDGSDDHAAHGDAANEENDVPPARQ